MLIRIAAAAVLPVALLAAQASQPAAIPAVPPANAPSATPSSANENSAAQSVTNQSSGSVQSAIPELQPDLNDPMVIRAKSDLERIRQLVNEGALPRLRLEKAEEDVQDALDMSILKKNIYSKDILPEQADQMVQIAERMVLRRQQSMVHMQQLVTSGVISQVEAQSSGADLERSRIELQLAITRANIVRQLAEEAKLQKIIAGLESQAESHPEWSGKVYTRYDGNGIFSSVDRQKVESAFLAHFFKPLPISADGETAVHRALGFDHRGRIDVGVNPDSPEGIWLIGYLQRNHIPYFAFRAAVPHRATGAHIHIGPQSARLPVSARIAIKGQSAAGKANSFAGL